MYFLKRYPDKCITAVKLTARLLPALTLFFLCIIPAACFFPGAIEDLDVRQVESLLKGQKKIVLVDNRNEMEYAAGHIPGACNIPQQNFPMIASFLPADKDTPILFYCSGYG